MSGSGAGAPDADGTVVGTVLESIGGVYEVALDESHGGGRVDAFLRGRLKREVRTGARVVPGDRVEVGGGTSDEDGDAVTIERVRSRDNELVRGGPGGRGAKVVVANVDRVAVVHSVAEPPFQASSVDRFLALVEMSHIAPFLVLNKIDLPGGEEVVEMARELYEAVGYPVVPTSAETGEGVESLGGMFGTGISAMIGPSGVGKSSLLNTLLPDLELRTAPVTRRGGQGRHTTVGARLLRCSPRGWIADTPGFSEVALWEVEPPALGGAFPEFQEHTAACRFRVCTHSHEPDCEVRAAVERGEIDERRYRSYLMLLDEVGG